MIQFYIKNTIFSIMAGELLHELWLKNLCSDIHQKDI